MPRAYTCILSIDNNFCIWGSQPNSFQIRNVDVVGVQHDEEEEEDNEMKPLLQDFSSSQENISYL